jgi:hypothetical protein
MQSPPSMRVGFGVLKQCHTQLQTSYCVTSYGKFSTDVTSIQFGANGAQFAERSHDAALETELRHM